MRQAYPVAKADWPNHMADYAAALFDVLETNQYLNQRIGVAY
ncbi:hypothetical protein WM008_14345 [Vibrio vulnificus]|nr:hypothetical protein [Vibrio vulnificus]